MPEQSLLNSDPNTSVRWRSRIFLAMWLVYAGFYFCRKNIGWTPLPLPDMSHRGFANFANVIFLFSAGYTVGQFVSGWIVDRYGPRIALCLGGLLSVLCTVMIAPGLPVTVMVALQMLNGFGQGFGWPAINKLFGAWFARSERAVVMAWWSTSYALGGFLATSFATILATSSIVSISTGARLALAVPAIILLATIIFFYLHVRDTPEHAGLPPTPGESSDPPDSDSSNSGWLPILRNREIQILSAMYFFLKLTRYALLFWLPVYLVDTFHDSRRAALNTASLFELIGFLGALIAAYVSDRLLGGRRYPVGASMLFLLSFVFLLHPLVSRTGEVGIAVSISLAGILIYGPDLLMDGPAVLEAVPLSDAGRASACVNGVGSIGQMLSPLLVTAFARRFGWDSIFNLFVVCSLIAGALLAMSWDHPASKTSTADILPAP